MFLFGVLPLIAFVVIDSAMGLKAGLVSAIILSMAESAYSIYEFGSLDELSIASLILVCAFALISLKTKKAIYMKLQPVFLGLCFAIILFVMQVMGKPLLVVALEKYDSIIPIEFRSGINNPLAKDMLARVSFYLGFGFLAHALVVLYAALRMSNWWWLIIRGLGVYVMMLACIVIARFA